MNICKPFGAISCCKHTVKFINARLIHFRRTSIGIRILKIKVGIKWWRVILKWVIFVNFIFYIKIWIFINLRIICIISNSDNIFVKSGTIDCASWATVDNDGSAVTINKDISRNKINNMLKVNWLGSNKRKSVERNN